MVANVAIFPQLSFTFMTNFSLFCTFAAVNVKTKRHIASWILLAVFVPMLILSSIHVHEIAKSSDSECNECVQHRCHGHVGEQTAAVHACVLCQFLTLSFVPAAVFAVVIINKVSKIHFAHRQSDIRFDVCGIPTLRAPPFV